MSLLDMFGKKIVLLEKGKDFPLQTLCINSHRASGFSVGLALGWIFTSFSVETCFSLGRICGQQNVRKNRFVPLRYIFHMTVAALLRKAKQFMGLCFILKIKLWTRAAANDYIDNRLIRRIFFLFIE